MTQPTTTYTITAAHRITGKSRTTIQKHLKKGKLSSVEGPDGVRMIEASELMRVYGDACDFRREEGRGSQREEGPPAASYLELESVRNQLNTLEQERRREREQLQAQIDQLQASLRLAQEGHNRATLLLENHSGGGGWRAAVIDLESRIERTAVQVREEGRQLGRQEFLNHPWWRLLWGSIRHG